MNTVDLPRALRGGSRRHVRIEENTRLLWHIKESGLVGHGRIRNLSASGMLVELTSVNAFPDQSIFSFDSNLNDANYIPDTGHLVWRKKKRFSSNEYLCGFQFADLPVVLLYRLKKRIESGVRDLIRMWKINRAVSIFLGVVTGALIGYAVWLGGVIFQDVSRSNEGFLATATQQADLTREYQRFYADTTRQLADVTLELNQTTALYADTTRRLADVTLGLNQTTALYQESRKSLQATQQELAVVKSVLSQTESLLAAAQAKNGGAKQQAVAAGSQAGQASAALINQIKYENRLPRISALAERDRVRLMYGNQGYFVKGGQPVQVDEQQYQATSFDALPPGKVPNPDPKVRVNVTVFQ